MGSTVALAADDSDAVSGIPVAVPVADGKAEAVVLIDIAMHGGKGCGDWSPIVDERSKRIDRWATARNVWDGLCFFLELIDCLVRCTSLWMIIPCSSDCS
jgi:hypothetical protein